jgi:hypothetical protein
MTALINNMPLWPGIACIAQMNNHGIRDFSSLLKEFVNYYDKVRQSRKKL